MQPFSKYNDGVKYLLTVIDVFSKYGWMRPLKRKTGEEVARLLRASLNSEGNQRRCGSIKAENSIIRM